MFLKIFFLFTYFIILFIGVRIIEFSIEIYSLLENESNFLQKDIFPAQNEKKDGLKTVEVLETDTSRVLKTYFEFAENVEDTKACVWVVLIRSHRSKSYSLDSKSWNWLSFKLKNFGIKTATYDCKVDSVLCQNYKIFKSTVFLSMPKSSHPKGGVSISFYDGFSDKHEVFTWIQKRMYFKVKTVHSYDELINQPKLRNQNNAASMSFIYHSIDNRFPHLLFSSLSVRFTGRIKFYMLKSEDNTESIIAMNKFGKYAYGEHKGENISYTCIDFFLRTLHPDLNDIFMVSVVLINMACWLELFLQRGGPIRRIIFFTWVCLTMNMILVSIWVPLSQLFVLPEMQPIINFCLKALQHLMLSDFAAMVRQDFLQVMQHLYIALIGFICYGIILGYIRYKILNNGQNLPDSLLTILLNDIRELENMLISILSYVQPTFAVFIFEESIERMLNRLSTPDLWLHSINPNEYITELPSFAYCKTIIKSDAISDEENNPVGRKTAEKFCNCKNELSLMQTCFNQNISDCAICLSVFKCKNLLTGLPCKHIYHKDCITKWLLCENSKHRCPICRWPARVKKGNQELIDLTQSS